jgi:16S rRNA (cytosine1402-N4)-methyltransferase
MAHLPVLLNEVLATLKPTTGETVLDGTVGSGGHALAIGEQLGSIGLLIGLDQDAEAILKATETLKSLSCQVRLIKSNFRHLAIVIAEQKLPPLDGLLLDLGIHSDQLAESGRGFSFQRDEPLDMRMGAEAIVTAAEVVNDWSEASLTDILLGFGEERHAKAIAKAIVTERKHRPFETTFDLIEVIKQAVPEGYTKRRLHFATKTFQAIRMAVNEELQALDEVMPQALAALAPGGRLAIITFHSGEARIIKRHFRAWRAQGLGEAGKKALKPTRAEVLENPRSRSATLRHFVKN